MLKLNKCLVHLFTNKCYAMKKMNPFLYINSFAFNSKIEGLAIIKTIISTGFYS